MKSVQFIDGKWITVQVPVEIDECTLVNVPAKVTHTGGGQQTMLWLSQFNFPDYVQIISMIDGTLIAGMTDRTELHFKPDGNISLQIKP